MIESYVIAMLIAIFKGYDIGVVFSRPEIVFQFFVIIFIAVTGLIMTKIGALEKMNQIKPYMVFLYFIAFLMPQIVNYRAFNLIYLIVSIALYVIGGRMNDLVVKANGGKMPVYPFISVKLFKRYAEKAKNKPIYIMGDTNTRLKILSDWIDVGYDIYSPGDLINLASYGLLFYNLIVFLN
jgi:hypothetical protein